VILAVVVILASTTAIVWALAIQSDRELEARDRAFGSRADQDLV
jgi:hypothetical protein